MRSRRSASPLGRQPRRLSQSGGGSASSFGDATGRAAQRAFEAVQHDFGNATQTIFHVMAGIMVFTFVVAHLWLPKDRVEAVVEPGDDVAAPAA